MREIKFRAKRIDNGEWVYGSYVHIDFHDSVDYVERHIIIQLNGHEFEVDGNTVGQSTNLPDKNEKEIYEDDIIIREYNDKKRPDETGEIKFDDGCAGFYIDGQLNWMDYEHLFMCKVIGNVYEHPDLLK